MPVRPGRCYKHFSGPAYTRKKYMGGIPEARISKFTMGTPNPDYAVTVHIASSEDGQIRHNALEAARVAAHKYLTAKVNDANYYIRLEIYPHHIIRENKMIAGAGADRLQDGMRASFGKPIGTAARVFVGQRIFTIQSHPQFFPQIREAYRVLASKLPLHTNMVVEKGQELVRTSA